MWYIEFVHIFFSIMIICINNIFLLIKGLLADHDEIHLYLILNYTLYKNPAF